MKKIKPKIYKCKWCDWAGPEHELDKFGAHHECCPKCRSIDVNILKKPNPKDYGLNDVAYYQACKDYKILTN